MRHGGATMWPLLRRAGPGHWQEEIGVLQVGHPKALRLYFCGLALNAAWADNSMGGSNLCISRIIMCNTACDLRSG